MPAARKRRADFSERTRPATAQPSDRSSRATRSPMSPQPIISTSVAAEVIAHRDWRRIAPNDQVHRDHHGKNGGQFKQMGRLMAHDAGFQSQHRDQQAELAALPESYSDFRGARRALAGLRQQP